MEAAAAFLLLLIFIFVAVVGGGLWLLVSTLRRRKLSPGEDKIDRHMLGRDESAAGAVDGHPAEDAESEERPEHTRVSNEQHSRSMPRR